jgi:hypothetical protein
MFHRLLRGVFNFMTRDVWREFQDACRDPVAAQKRRLFTILRRNADTDFGREHSFASIRSVEDFRSALPIREFSAFEKYIERMRRGESGVLTADLPEMFATTSGTTDRPKFIPVTPSFYAEFYNTQKVWSRINLNAHPAILRGKFLSLVSPWEEGRTEGGIPYGAISGRNYRNHASIPVQRNFLAIPYSVFCARDFDAKYYAILLLAARQSISLISILNPSTIVLLARKLNEYAPDLVKDIRDGGIKVEKDLPPEAVEEIRPRLRPQPRRAKEIENALEREGELLPRDIWPDLALVNTWTGGASGFYLKQFARLFGDVPLRDFGYNASEGYMSIPCRGTTTAHPEDKGGVLAAAGHFVEFVPYPQGGEPLLCDGLEAGRRYRVILTASNGLYRYDINDVIEVLAFEGGIPVIAFKHRGSGVVSVTGEKVTESQVTLAFRRLCDRLDLDIEDFIVGVRYEETPLYAVAVEPAGADVREGVSELLAREFDEELKKANMEYRAKRDSGRLAAPRANILRRGAMTEYRKRRIGEGMHDAQMKMLHLVKAPRLFEEFDALHGSDASVDAQSSPRPATGTKRA